MGPCAEVAKLIAVGPTSKQWVDSAASCTSHVPAQTGRTIRLSVPNLIPTVRDPLLPPRSSLHLHHQPSSDIPRSLALDSATSIQLDLFKLAVLTS